MLPSSALCSPSQRVGRLLRRGIPAGAPRCTRNLLSSSKSKRHANCWRACTFVIYDYRGTWFLERVSKYFYS